MKTRLKQYLENTTANTAIIFSLAAIPMLLVAGAAVDMVRANRTSAILQGAADAAALAGGVSGFNSKSQLETLVQDYLAANGAQGALASVDAIVVDQDKKSGVLSVRIDGKIQTSFMKLAGIGTLDIGASAEVMRGSQALEIALVLDNTDSMSFDGRITALKSSARELISEVFDNKDSDTYIKIGIVPFANYVNVGLDLRSESWMSVPADSSVPSEWCRNEYPDATKSNCRMEPSSYVQDGVTVNTTAEQCDWNYGTPKYVCSPSSNDTVWRGCVGSRNSPMDRNIGSAAVPYPGVMNEWCPQKITNLSDDKTMLLGKIDALSTTGNTYIPAGLLWGWNMLNPAAPLTAAKTTSAMKALKGRKAIVLMTDGQNTLVPAYPNHVGSPALPAVLADDILADICSNVKDDDIEIYTVAFMVDDAATKDMLVDCASDPSKSFDASDSAELSASFRKIAESLSAVRLTK